MTSRAAIETAIEPFTAVVGDHASTEVWARALRAADAPHPRVFQSADDFINELADAALIAICIASPIRDLGAVIKRAAIARKHMLVVPPLADSRQLLLLDELARNRARVLLFDACGAGDAALEAVRDAALDEHPLRRPRYIRIQRSAPSVDALEAVAIEAVSRVLALTPGLPAFVGAIGPRFESDADRDLSGLTSITLRFEAGLVARIDASSLEIEDTDAITVMCEGRTTVIERDHHVAPVRVLTALRRQEADGVRTRVEVPAVEIQPHEMAATTAFVESMQSQQPTSNARELAAAALVWETARKSLALGGEMLELRETHPLIATNRPQLQLIRGGGHTVENVAAPRLRVVRGGRPQFEDSAPPPRSA